WSGGAGTHGNDACPEATRLRRRHLVLSLLLASSDSDRAWPFHVALSARHLGACRRAAVHGDICRADLPRLGPQLHDTRGAGYRVGGPHHQARAPDTPWASPVRPSRIGSRRRRPSDGEDRTGATAGLTGPTASPS